MYEGGKKYLHRTQGPENAHKQKSIVCVICNQFTIKAEKVHYLSKDNISAHTQDFLWKVTQDTMRQCLFLK